MRVLYVIGIYPPAGMAGPPEQLHRLAREFSGSPVEVRVVTTNTDERRTTDVATDRWVDFEGVSVYYGRRLPGTHHLSIGAWRTIRSEARRADVIHVTGIFSWMNLVTAAAARRTGIPVVASPRGALDAEALGFSAAKKAWFFRMGGRRALEEVAVFHVTSEMEGRHVEAFLPGARVGTVGNGVFVPSDDELSRWTHPPATHPTVLFLGRIHAKKNVIPLVHAWAAVAPRHPGARLILAGPDDHGHRAEVERVIAGLRLGGCVTLAGRVTGEPKSRLVAGAACLILPSLTENFGNVVAEALACRVPAIASTGTPWSGLRDRGCGWWIDPTVNGLAAAMDEALSLDPSARAAMGERGRLWMTAEFSWPQVARAMRDLYDRAMSNRREPR